jgi:predicted metal-dependent HD superfamily phosphohydrolase
MRPVSSNQAVRLAERWAELAGSASAARLVGRELLTRYAEPHRRYHTSAHLLAVLDMVDQLAGQAAAADTVRLAAWFHDAVYDPDRGDNEQRSAELAEQRLGALGMAPCVAEVARLVRLTASHTPAPEDRNGAVLCDADLAVLGSPPCQYAAYAAAVRAEYAALPEALFRAGRAAVLERLLALPVLFHTPPARRRLERQARQNLAVELAGLRAGTSGGGATTSR